MATLTVQVVDEDGTVATYNAAASGGDDFVNNGKTFLHIKNADAASKTVTVAALVSSTRKPGFGSLTKANAAVTIAATTDAFLGPFPIAAFGLKPSITYDAVTSLTLAVLRI